MQPFGFPAFNFLAEAVQMTIYGSGQAKTSNAYAKKLIIHPFRLICPGWNHFTAQTFRNLSRCKMLYCLKSSLFEQA